MTPRQLEVFRAVMLTGSITAAAERMHVSQPAVSKQIQLLESAVGFALFQRMGNRLHPTAEAMLLFDQVQTVYTGLKQIERFAASIRENRAGEVSVGSMPLLAHFWLPRIVADLMQNAVDTTLSLPVRSTDWLLRAVAAGRVDIGLCLSDPHATDVDSVPLMKLPLVCLVRPGHRFEQQLNIAPHQLETEAVVVLRSFDGQSVDALRVPEVRRRGAASLEVFTTAAAGEIVLAGFGVAIVDALTARFYEERGLVARAVETDAQFDLSLISTKSRKHTRMTDFVRSEILRLAQKTELELGTQYALR
ncbi:LysR substrate-binding domain-containing protein [Roseovarius sp. E0-M6]|uniref:LysR substrate-binding domain-containing protein n=1 Tax=Roseovarius sp. E0-M6 TaxID=3127118 RepID=UPI00300FF962